MRSKPRADNGPARIEAIRNSLGMTPSEFSLALGYCTGGGIDASIRSDSVTEMQILAAEGLAARRGMQRYARLLLTISPEGHVTAMPVSADPTSEIVIGDRRYLLVPL